MSRDAQLIREEIEQTRGQLGQTLEAIGDRVSPRHMVEDLAEKVSPRRLVRRQTDKMKEGITNVGDTMKSKANGAVNGIASAVPSIPKPSLAKPSIPSVTLPKVDLRAKDRATPENAPLLAGAVAFGAGLAVALAVRSTSRERQVAGATRITSVTRAEAKQKAPIRKSTA